MSGKLILISIFLVMQGTFLSICVFSYRAVVDKAKSVGEVVKDFAEMYYDDHIKTRVEPYMTWPTFNRTSLWEGFKQRVYKYSPV
uniref:Uncharacterized protein n=1 Tax=Denticeps clupeoides TaxID=299321 RepID=A0AAY4AKU1_9TELE